MRTDSKHRDLQHDQQHNELRSQRHGGQLRLPQVVPPHQTLRPAARQQDRCRREQREPRRGLADGDDVLHKKLHAHARRVQKQNPDDAAASRDRVRSPGALRAEAEQIVLRPAEPAQRTVPEPDPEGVEGEDIQPKAAIRIP